MSLGGMFGSLLTAVAFALLLVLAVLSFLMPWFVYRIKRSTEDMKTTLDSALGVMELTRREIAELRKNQGIQVEGAARIEKILSVAHNVRFEE